MNFSADQHRNTHDNAKFIFISIHNKTGARGPCFVVC